MRSRRIVGAAVLAPLLALLAAACGTSSAGTPGGSKPAADTLRLGYFANVTHATAVVGVAKGFYAKSLGATKLTTQIFKAGPAEVEALFGGGLDAGYLGPNPSINAFTKSHGAYVIVSGATSGGAQLVVDKSITDAKQLKGKTLASPQLGNTQDVALRAWLASKGLRSSVNGGGDVTITPQDNATTLTAFKAGKIAGAWVPEPWASRLVVEGKGHLLVDEKSLWPGGRFVTTDLVVSKRFLQLHPQTVKALLTGQLATQDWIAAHPQDAQTVVNSELKRLTGKALKPGVITRAWADITLTDDPIASSLQTSAQHATAAGLLGKTNLKGIYDLRLLDQLLAARGQPAPSTAGL